MTDIFATLYKTVKINFPIFRRAIIDALPHCEMNLFHELYLNYPKTSIGYRPDETANPDDMLLYYSKNAIDKWGALAIGIKVY